MVGVKTHAPIPGASVTVNAPFRGGHVTRSHGREMPWVQLEMSRAHVLDVDEKRRRTLAALTDWCALGLPANRA